MKQVVLFFILFTDILFSDTLESLLKEYEITSENSLKTVDEKLGNVFIYSQKDIRLMQYNTLDDILKELPVGILNKNRFGFFTLSLTGSKTSSGFFRFFIDDHEISSAYTQSASQSWGDLPLDFIDHIEIYYGESSFALGNATGMYFVRIYTKSAVKENGGELKSVLFANGSSSHSIVHSQSFENGWSYLFFLNKNRLKDKTEYNNEILENSKDRKYFYVDVSNENTNINIGYTDLKKDAYMGLSFDVIPDSSQIKSNDFFVNITKYLLDDKSIKIAFSMDVENREYEEENVQGIGLIPVLDLANMGTTTPKYFSEDLKFTKTNAYVAKSIKYKNNNIITAFNITNKKYKVKNRKTINFLNQTNKLTEYNNFNEEMVYSLLLQDDYKVNNNLLLIANAKVDKYKRESYIKDSIESLFRLGVIYTPYENFGLKVFYTETYLPPSFYNVDFVDKRSPNLKSQKYKYYSIEGVYTTNKSKFGIIYHNVKIDDFMYLTPVGFTNIDHAIKTQGIMFNYEYQFSQKNKINLNYFITKLNDITTSPTGGGYIKFVGEHNKLGYFSSLIYKNFYKYDGEEVKNSFDLSLGVTYSFTKDFSCSIKGENLLDKSTKSLYTKGFSKTDFPLNNNDRRVLFSMKWVF